MTESGPGTGSPLQPQTIDALAALKIEVLRVVEGLQGGAHSSLHLGASVEFAEHKRYAPGDDIRHLDWRVLARTDRYFVKQYEREVILNCLMLLDRSPSMNYRGSRAEASKLDYAVVLLAAMAHVLVRQGDAAGLLTFSETVDGLLPPQRHPDHLSAMMKELVRISPAAKGGTGYVQAITQAAERAGGRAMVVLASDLWGAGEETATALVSLASRGHDVVVFHLLDPDEVDFPFDEPTTFQGLEGEGEVNVNPALLREDYRDELARWREKWLRFSGEAGFDMATSLTGTPPELVLADFARRRHRTGARR